jgi:uncharacterized lipoprotein YddW (UPF0748 family)
MWQNYGQMNKEVRQAWLILATVLMFVGVILVAAQGSGKIYAPAVMRGPVSYGTPVVKVNYQPAGAAVPDGYLPDTGAVYAGRGNGFTYGWLADNSATTRERNSPFADDQRFDTLIHLQRIESPDAIWEIALTPGVYEVYAAAGDPEFYDGFMHSTAEGVTLLSGAPEAGRRFITGTARVTVTDNRLTIRSGPNAVNNKLLFVEIYQIEAFPTPPPPDGMVEFRGLWVTRFDWTTGTQPASPAKIDEIVNNAAGAGFNAILFQVRASADAFYAPGLEPWAQRVSGGAFGQPPSPFWDPLAYFVQRAHERGMQLHAYVNVYPITGVEANKPCSPPPMVSPTPLYYLLQSAHGETDGKLNAAQWTTQGLISCGEYVYASPASTTFRAHVKAVVADLVNRYDIDGIHFDRVRYTGSNTSCDPVSAAAYGGACFTGSPGQYATWQREQINTLVRETYDEIIVPAGREIWLTAAVWPTYIDKWGWGYSEGYHDYYQDSQGWVKSGDIDAIMPMIYSSQGSFPLDKWQTLAADFQANRGDRFVVPGIGAAQAPFSEIDNRIITARQLGTAGHALFSYGALLTYGYFDDLKAGPYAEPATVPDIPWHD